MPATLIPSPLGDFGRPSTWARVLIAAVVGTSLLVCGAGAATAQKEDGPIVTIRPAPSKTTEGARKPASSGTPRRSPLRKTSKAATTAKESHRSRAATANSKRSRTAKQRTPAASTSPAPVRAVTAPPRRRSTRTKRAVAGTPRSASTRIAEVRASDKKPETLGVRPESAVSLNAQAYRLQKRGRHATAELLLRRALELKPDYPYALYNLGWSLVAQGKAREALAPLHQTAAKQPERWEPYQRISEAYAQLGLPEKAAAYAIKADGLRRGHRRSASTKTRSPQEAE